MFILPTAVPVVIEDTVTVTLSWTIIPLASRHTEVILSPSPYVKYSSLKKTLKTVMRGMEEKNMAYTAFFHTSHDTKALHWVTNSLTDTIHGR